MLIPGVGNDALLKDMCDSRWVLTALDYALAGIECEEKSCNLAVITLC